MNQESLQLLVKQATAEIIDRRHLEDQLQRGKPLRVKLGIDPSAPHLHIGHAVPLRKLRQFQDAGHTAVLIIGDYTAQIGDPTGKNESRVMLSAETVKENAQNYLDQAYIILNPHKTEVRYQTEWFDSFSLRDCIDLMAKVTVSHLLSHETFAQRLNKNQPLHTHELLYPLLQGYDSVAVKADVELGGQDQKFNVLMGRMIQRAYGLAEQDVMLFPYLPGIDGQAKMSKSLDNAIHLDDSPETMFGKIMSIPDSLIPIYLELATSATVQEVKVVQEKLKSGIVNPKELKVDLGKALVKEYYSEALSNQAAEAFDKQFRQKQMPNDMHILTLKPNVYELDQLLVSRTTLVSSKSEVRRLITQQGIKKNGLTVTDIHETIQPEDGPNVTIQIGGRRFVRIVWKST